MVGGAGAWGQGRYRVAFDWGAAGAAQVVSPGDVLIVVDVLSFTTSVSVAVERGTVVYPAPWRDGRAAALAAREDAQLAVGRREVTPVRPWSLSPAALRVGDLPARLVLPSPNGSAIAAVHPDATVIAACLRNARAVAGRAAGLLADGRRVCVVAAGERWPDGSLRPALEDALGAGAVLAALADIRPDVSASPEACAVAAMYTGTPDVARAVTGCASAGELRAGGYGQDVDVAVELNGSDVVPVLSDRAFRARST